MKRERMIEILAEANITPTTKHHSYDYLYNQALTAMQRAVEEELATLRAEVERLKERIVELQDELFDKENNPNYNPKLNRLRECEAIVRELADRYNPYQMNPLWRLEEKARKWVRENPK